MHVNILKAKEMLIDLRKRPPPIPPVFIHNQVVEVVQPYKYLGTLPVNNLTFDIDVVEMPTSMGIFTALPGVFDLESFIRMFYSCSIELVLTFAFSAGLCA